MKNSGIEWIGEIPDNWKVEKIKYHLQRREPRNPGEAQVLSVYRDYGVIPKDSRDDNHNVTSEDTSKYKYVVKGNLVINKMKAWQGSMAVSDYEGIVSPAYFIYHFTDEAFNKKYFHFLIRGCYKEEFRRISSGIREGQWDLPSNKFENEYVLIPPLDEQKKIANFLDEKCAEIDGLISDLNEEISTLEEYKRSTITEAVCKGLNPNAEMKDSGIEWVGRVPINWNIHPLYYYFDERKNKNVLGRETNLLSLSYGNVIRKDINTNGGLLPENFNGYNIIEKDDIVLRLTDLQNDKKSLRTGLCKERGIITSAYVTIKPKKSISSHYFRYLLHSYDLMKVLYNMGNGVRQGLNFDELKKMMLIEPPIEEQMNIVDFLDEKCVEIDAVISEKQEQISTLEQYKKSIIYEYTTGKKEVV